MSASSKGTDGVPLRWGTPSVFYYPTFSNGITLHRLCSGGSGGSGSGLAVYDPNSNLWLSLFDALKAEQEERATRQARKLRLCPACGEPLEVISITDNRHPPGSFDVIALCQNCRSNYEWFCDKDGGVTDMKEYFFG